MDGDERGMFPDIKQGKIASRMVHTPPPPLTNNSNSSNNSSSNISNNYNNNQGYVQQSATKGGGGGPISNNFNIEKISNPLMPSNGSSELYSMELVLKRLQVLESRADIGGNEGSNSDIIARQVNKVIEQKLGGMDRALDTIVRDVSDIRTNFGNEINELKSIISAEISARRKFQMASKASIEAMNKQLQNDTFSLRKEFLHLCETLGSRVRILESHHADQSLAVKSANDDIKDYVQGTIIKMRQQLEMYDRYSMDINDLKRRINKVEAEGIGGGSGGNGNGNLDILSGRLEILEGDLKKTKPFKGNLDKLASQLNSLADQTDENIGSLHRKIEGLDAKVKKTVNQTMKDISEELEQYVLNEEFVSLKHQITGLKALAGVHTTTVDVDSSRSRRQRGDDNDDNNNDNNREKRYDESGAATKIQSIYRGGKARKQTTSANNNNNNNNKGKNQRREEGYMSPSSSLSSSSSNKQNRRELRSNAYSGNSQVDLVSDLDEIIDDHPKTNNFNNSRSSRSNKYESEDVAAARIQSIYRGGKVRKNKGSSNGSNGNGNGSRRSNEEPVLIVISDKHGGSDDMVIDSEGGSSTATAKHSLNSDNESHLAASKIQSRFRGAKVRKSNTKIMGHNGQQQQQHNHGSGDGDIYSETATNSNHNSSSFSNSNDNGGFNGNQVDYERDRAARKIQRIRKNKSSKLNNMSRREENDEIGESHQKSISSSSSNNQKPHQQRSPHSPDQKRLSSPVDENTAATKMQSLYRGGRARRQYKGSSSVSSNSSSKQETVVIGDAAVEESGERGKKEDIEDNNPVTSKEIREQEIAALKIQKVARKRNLSKKLI